jgi:hypothetical protein
MEMTDLLLTLGVFLGVFIVLCPCFVYLERRCVVNKTEDIDKGYEPDDGVEDYETEKRRRENEDNDKELPAIVIGDTVSHETDEDDDDYYLTRTRTGDLPRYEIRAGSHSHEDVIKNASSIREVATTVDVHVCNSVSCDICKKNQTNKTEFVEAGPAIDLVDRIRNLPNRWWEATYDTLFDKGAITMISVDDEDDENQTTFSRWSKRSKRRPKKKQRRVNEQV